MYFRCPRLQKTALTQQVGDVRSGAVGCGPVPLASPLTVTLSRGFTNSHSIEGVEHHGVRGRPDGGDLFPLEGSSSYNIHGTVVVMCRTHNAGEYFSGKFSQTFVEGACALNPSSRILPITFSLIVLERLFVGRMIHLMPRTVCKEKLLRWSRQATMPLYKKSTR